MSERVNLLEWLAETPWGTTRAGLFSRLAAPAALSALAVALITTSPAEGAIKSTSPPGWILFIGIGLLGVLMWILPWLAQRYAPKRGAVTRAWDHAFVIPSAIVTLLVILAEMTLHNLGPLPLLCVALQTVLAILGPLVVPNTASPSN